MDTHIHSLPPSPSLLLVSPRIISQPQLGEAFSNERVTLTVTFQSHQEATTIVRWFKNNIPISSTNINTIYGSAPNATTELHFEQITREDRGRYRVEIENTAEVIPADMRGDVSTFDVDVQGKNMKTIWYRSSASVWSEKVVKMHMRMFVLVHNVNCILYYFHSTVPPSRPAGVTVNRINDTHVNISWTLTNLTADAGAEVLTLHLHDHPHSPFRLEPNQEEWILYSEPGMMYNLTLKAMNPDGVASTDPMAVKLPATGKITIRVNLNP